MLTVFHTYPVGYIFFVSLVASVTWSIALIVLMAGINTEAPGTNLSQSTKIRTPSGEMSVKRILVIVLYRKQRGSILSTGSVGIMVP